MRQSPDTPGRFTPALGDKITIATEFQRKWSLQDVYNYKELVPECLDYIDGTARWQDSAVSGAVATPSDPEAPGMGNVRVESPRFDSWRVPGAGKDWGGGRAMSMQFTVGPDCAAGTDLMTTMHFGGSDRGGVYQDKGPTFNVKYANSQTQVIAPTSASVGKETTVKAHVSGGSAKQHQGDVEFFADGRPIGVGATDANGDAAVAWTPKSSGPVNLTAKYGGNLNTSPSSSGALTAEVSEVTQDTTTVLEAPATARVGKSAVLAAQVSPAGAGGEVTFRENGTVISTARVTDSSGRVQIDWVPQTKGERTITAEFSGRAGFGASQSGVSTVTVEAPAPDVVDSTTKIDPVAGGVTGQSVELKARVSATGGAPVGGTVTFKDGDRIIGTGTVQSGGLATTTWTPDYSGARTITAEYSGSDSVRSSAGTITVQIVGPDRPGGDGNEGENGNGGSDSLGNLGSLIGIFGSLGSGS